MVSQNCLQNWTHWLKTTLTNSAGRLHSGCSVQGLLLLFSVLVSASMAAVMVVMVVSSLLTLALVLVLARPGWRVGHLGPFQVVGLQAILVLVLLRQWGRWAPNWTEVNNGLRRRRWWVEKAGKKREAVLVIFNRSDARGSADVHDTQKDDNPADGNLSSLHQQPKWFCSSHRWRKRLRRMNIDLKYLLWQTALNYNVADVWVGKKKRWGVDLDFASTNTTLWTLTNQNTVTMHNPSILILFCTIWSMLLLLLLFNSNHKNPITALWSSSVQLL